MLKLIYTGLILLVMGIVSSAQGFKKSRGQLIWPVDFGTVAIPYRPPVQTVCGRNSRSLTINVGPGTAVKAVFEGEVGSVFSVGDVQAVMIRHGQYFTTYSNLGTVSVTKGEQVKRGQIIGRVGEINQLEFLISDEKDRELDPWDWLMH